MNKFSRNERLVTTIIISIFLFIVVLIPVSLLGKKISLIGILPFLFFGFAYTLIIYIFGGIEKRRVNNLNQVITIYLLANIAAFIVFFSINGLLRNPFKFDLSFLLLIISGFNFPILVFVLYNYVFNNLSPRRAVVIGDKSEWSLLVNEICEKSLRSIDIISYMHFKELTKQNIFEITQNIDFLIVTSPEQIKHFTANNFNTPILSLHSLVEFYLKKIPFKILENYREYYELTFSNPIRSKIATLIDFLLSAFLLIIVSPILLFSIILILILDGKPIFFMQDRHGFYGKKFKIFKLRTMDLNDDGIARTTKSGGLLRKLRINEVPQLINILKGEMSLIGPRPDVTTTYEFCIERIPFYAYRTYILPGITGNAQLNYKYIETLDQEAFTERLAFDLHYLKNQTAFDYISIFFKTFESLFKAKGK